MIFLANSPLFNTMQNLLSMLSDQGHGQSSNRKFLYPLHIFKIIGRFFLQFQSSAEQIYIMMYCTSDLVPGMGNFRINPDFRIENFHFKHEIPLLHLFTRPSFVSKVVIWVDICLK